MPPKAATPATKKSSASTGGAAKKKTTTATTASATTTAGTTKKTKTLLKKTAVGGGGVKSGTTKTGGTAAASKKKASASSSSHSSSATPAPASIEWPPEAELGAVAIQSVFRGFQARRDVNTRREELSKKKAYDEEMNKMRQAAFLMEVELERKEEAKRRKVAEIERKRKATEAKLLKDMLEASFDGEVDDLKALVDQGGDPECSDNHGNTCLSEAAAGGDAATVEFLVSVSRVDPNSKGEFGRTPLWRACFMGKADVIPVLLAAGADPRIPNESGETCEMMAASEVRERERERERVFILQHTRTHTHTPTHTHRPSLSLFSAWEHTLHATSTKRLMI